MDSIITNEDWKRTLGHGITIYVGIWDNFYKIQHC